MSEARTALLEEVCRSYRLFAALGWGDLGDGHISARDPDQSDCFWLLRYGVPFGDASPDQLVLLNSDGEAIDGEGPVNRAGFRIHMPILTARPDVTSAVHTHTFWGTPFSASSRQIEPITQESCFFYNDCADFDDDEVQIQDIAGGARIAQCIGKKNSVILRNHGLLTVGTTVAEAVVRFVLLERVCEAHVKMPDAKPIGAEAASYAKNDLTRTGVFEAMFGYLTRHHSVH